MRSLPIALCFSVAAIGLAAAQDAPAPDPRLAPMSIHYERLEQAYAEKDAAMILAYRTPDFFVDAPGGVHIDTDTARDILLNFVAESGDPVVLDVQVQCAHLLNDAEAEFVVTQNLTRTLDVNGEDQQVQSQETQTDTWRLTPEGWRLASITDIHDGQQWVNGVAVGGPVAASGEPDCPPAG